MPINEKLSREDDVFFQSELKQTEKQIIQTDYPELQFAQGNIIPLSNEFPAGTEFYSYRVFNKLGVSKIIANNADDLPRVGVDYKEIAGKVVATANEFALTFRDIRKSSIAKRSLRNELMFSSKEAAMTLLNETIQYGNSVHNLPGLYNNDNVTEYAVSTVGSGTPNTLWLDNGFAVKTPDQIIADVNGLIRSVIVLSKGKKRPNMVLLPLEHYTHIVSTPRSGTSETTILQWLERNNPGVRFIGVEELNKERLTEKGILGPDGVSALTGAMMMALTVALDTVKAHFPMPYTLQPTYQIGLEMRTPTEMEHGGTDIKKPYAFAYGKNI
jgi:hypothetical protein